MQTPPEQQRSHHHHHGDDFAKHKESKEAWERKLRQADFCAELCDGRLIPLDMKRQLTIGELKHDICKHGGYDPDQHELKHKGKQLDNAITLGESAVKRSHIVKLVFTMQLKRKKALWELTSADVSPVKRKFLAETDDEEEEVTSTHGSSSGSDTNPEELANAISNALKKVLTEEEHHVKCISPRSQNREASRKLAQEKATVRRQLRAKHMPLLRDKADFVAVLSDVAQKLLPDMFVHCTPTPAKEENMVRRKRHSFGGS